VKLQEDFEHPEHSEKTLFTAKIRQYSSSDFPGLDACRMLKNGGCLRDIPFARRYLTPAAILVTWVSIYGSLLSHLRFLRNIEPSFWHTHSKLPSSNDLLP
jgi:hypothetical protein